jgi:hypothetical protein
VVGQSEVVPRVRVSAVGKVKATNIQTQEANVRPRREVNLSVTTEALSFLVHVRFDGVEVFDELENFLDSFFVQVEVVMV